MLKNLSAGQKTQFSPWVVNIPWEREWLPNPVFLPGKSYGQRSLAGHTPWDFKSRTRLNN